MAHATAHIGTTNFATLIRIGDRTIQADEPSELGGMGDGFGPHDLLLAGLGACTAITLRMYAIRKGWDLRAVDVDLRHVREETRSRITRRITLTGAMTDEQRVRFAEIAERTPVTLTLKAGADITTTVSVA